MSELPKNKPLVISVLFIGKEGLTMVVRKLKEFLDSNKIKYDTIMHTPSYSAQEIAASAHISGNELAKTVLVKIDGEMTMVVLPAPRKVNLGLLKKVVGADIVELAGEQEFESRFPDCDLGAMPPFGNLYGMDVFVADELTKDEEIAFNAGSHIELIKLAYKDFEKLVHPKRTHISC
jgi:Ala-tRNA(Pro) deacylase